MRKILFVGHSSKAGSWQVRGLQMLGALGASCARATLAPTDRDFGWADVVICVKRCKLDVFHRARLHRCKTIWDPLDFWPAVDGSLWSEKKAIAELRRMIAERQPDGVIFANKRMLHDAAFPRAAMVLPHHVAPRQALLPTRNTREGLVVEYRGNPRYLGKWESILRDECSARGWRFDCSTVSPLFERADIAVAFRDFPYTGYAPLHWKSAVKAVQAMGAGVPFVHSPEMGYLEALPAPVCLPASSSKELCEHFDMLANFRLRQEISEAMHDLSADFSLRNVAKMLQRFVESL
jgi:hypothetical protein